MLDPKFIYENINLIRKVASDKFVDVDLDNFVSIYEGMKDSQKELDQLNASKKQAAANKDIELGKSLKEKGAMLEERVRDLEMRYRELAETIPNLYSPDTPYGKDDNENIVLKKW